LLKSLNGQVSDVEIEPKRPDFAEWLELARRAKTIWQKLSYWSKIAESIS
jgi:hypothetical protein